MSKPRELMFHEAFCCVTNHFEDKKCEQLSEIGSEIYNFPQHFKYFDKFEVEILTRGKIFAIILSEH